MWLVTEAVYEYDDERYTNDGGYHVEKVYKKKEDADKIRDQGNLEFIRSISMSTYYEYEWKKMLDPFMDLWDQYAPHIEVLDEIEIPRGSGSPWNYDKAFKKLMNLLPDDVVLKFMNDHIGEIPWGVQEVEVVE